ncbi:MAG: DUF1553 domain-containing protein [Pedosphaera sp.]|nr:DUF1553 domain-containing protein [Pedosphaera sp.]
MSTTVSRNSSSAAFHRSIDFKRVLIRIAKLKHVAQSLLTAVSLPLRAAENPSAALPPPASITVDFTRDIQPIFAHSCFKCHGPEKQKAGLRLDDHASALRGGDNHSPAIVPGKGSESPLLRIVAGLDPDLVMPPSNKGERLTSDQIALLRAWIDQGAIGSKEDASSRSESHWAFTPVNQPPIPGTTPFVVQPVNAIDKFIHQKLQAAGLTPSGEADRVTLARRLWLIMLGIPPTAEEVRDFVTDPRPDAYARLVDKVLSDPSYGERWGRHWLDVVRFAESNGFETNRERTSAWRFRDYIIAALNADKPYDRFVREQIVGDALGVDVATGFLVSGPVDIVGSPDPVLTAQQRADELDDIVSTTGTAFLGLTLGCARCHTHKFDPISQKEYYAMTAVFSGVKHGEHPLPLPPDQAMQVARLDDTLAHLEKQLAKFKLPADPASRVATGRPSLRPAVNPIKNEEILSPINARYIRFTILGANQSEPCIDELEVWVGERNVALATNGTRVTVSGTLPGYEIHKIEHINDGKPGNDRSWISNEAGRGWIQFELPRSERIDRIVWGRDRLGRFSDRLVTQYRFEAAEQPGQWTVIASSEDREPFLKKPAKPHPYRFELFSNAEAEQGRMWFAELGRVEKEREVAAKTPTTYSGTFKQPGATYRLHRGDPMQKRETVSPGTLALFRAVELSSDEPEQRRRQQLADWITNPANPLTARVLVNRIWQHHFGVGLVATPNDFGRNGARPTNPELLDWLASEFVTQGWSIKKLQRQILLSATWRQSSLPRPDALKIDGTCRLLWRFPPRRIEAEGIRDSILFASGSLDSSRGGPSFFLHNVDRENVYHYHPKEDFAPAEFRRMVYAFKVRMEQDGIFGAFDCPDGSLVAPRRTVSTTPLQALNLFNSRFTLDQAERFANRLRYEAGTVSGAQIRRAWQITFSREPSPQEALDSGAFVAREGLTALCRALLNSNEFLFIP